MKNKREQEDKYLQETKEELKKKFSTTTKVVGASGILFKRMLKKIPIILGVVFVVSVVGIIIMDIAEQNW